MAKETLLELEIKMAIPVNKEEREEIEAIFKAFSENLELINSTDFKDRDISDSELKQLIDDRLLIDNLEVILPALKRKQDILIQKISLNFLHEIFSKSPSFENEVVKEEKNG